MKRSNCFVRGALPLLVTSTLIAGCVSNKASVAECPVPSFLSPVTPSTLKEGQDLREAYHQRTTELVTANKRIVRTRSYMESQCGPPKN